jgi:vacuolar protein sorting-associated protein 18
MRCVFASASDPTVLCLSVPAYIPRGLPHRLSEYSLFGERLCDTNDVTQAKEYLPALALRRILALQNELIKSTEGAQDRANQPPAPVANGPVRQPTTQRTLLSANFATLANPLIDGTRAAGSLGRGILSAGDRLRDLIIPDALAAAVAAPTSWIPGIGGTRRNGTEREGGKKAETLRAELDDVLASNCPLCESVVAGLDKPFVNPAEVDTWAL